MGSVTLTRPCTCDNTGKGGVDYQLGWCYGCWLAHNRPDYARAYGLPEPDQTGRGLAAEAKTPEVRVRYVVPVIPRKVKCINIGKPLKRQPCIGSTPHGCDLGLPAMPAGYCQTCKRYEGDFNEDGVSGPGWSQ